MKQIIKTSVAIFYLSWGILYGLIASNFPQFFKPGIFFRRWGLVLLMSTSILCPIGMLLFGWLKNTSKSTIIWVFIFSVPAVAFWFLFSSFVSTWVAIGGDG